MSKENLKNYILVLGDSSMILGQRLGELCGHGPELETDIALTNISLDLFGQVRNYFQYAADVADDGCTEDDLAMLRLERDYKNALLVEQPNTDFAFVIARQFFYDVYHKLMMAALVNSKDRTLSAIAQKSIKEVRYHKDFSSTWMKRLGDGTGESHERLQFAVNELWRFAMDLFYETDVEKWAAKEGIAPDLKALKKEYIKEVKALCEEAKINIPEDEVFQYGGKEGRHSEYMGFILAEFQYMQRTFPNMKW